MLGKRRQTNAADAMKNFFIKVEAFWTNPLKDGGEPHHEKTSRHCGSVVVSSFVRERAGPDKQRQPGRNGFRLERRFDSRRDDHGNEYTNGYRHYRA